MKTVKTFTNIQEAGFVSSMLEGVGIPSSLADEQSSLAYGMATGGVRLLVADEDYERALRVLEGGPQSEPAPEGTDPDSMPPLPDEKGNGIPAMLFVTLMVAFCLLGLLIYFVKDQSWPQQRSQPRPSPTPGSGNYRTYDDNHDGNPDHFYTYVDGHVFHVEVDRNFDGRIDKWEKFDGEGVLQEMELDNNYDGNPDRWYYYKNGATESEKIDSDFNGIPDMFLTFKDGLLDRTDVRPNESPIVTRRYFYKDAILTEEWVDEKGDGFFNYKILHDPFGALSEHIPIHEKQ